MKGPDDFGLDQGVLPQSSKGLQRLSGLGYGVRGLMFGLWVGGQLCHAADRLHNPCGLPSVSCGARNHYIPGGFKASNKEHLTPAIIVNPYIETQEPHYSKIKTMGPLHGPLIWTLYIPNMYRLGIRAHTLSPTQTREEEVRAQIRCPYFKPTNYTGASTLRDTRSTSFKTWIKGPRVWLVSTCYLLRPPKHATSAGPQGFHRCRARRWGTGGCTA